MLMLKQYAYVKFRKRFLQHFYFILLQHLGYFIFCHVCGFKRCCVGAMNRVPSSTGRFHPLAISLAVGWCCLDNDGTRDFVVLLAAVILVGGLLLLCGCWVITCRW